MSKARRPARARTDDGRAPKKRPRKAEESNAPRKLALAIAEAGLDKKAAKIEIIEVRGKVDYADYVVLMSGRSDRQVQAIARNIEEHVKQQHGVRSIGVEGLPQATWVLLDFGDVVVHVFHEETRGYYDLESLWIDADRVHVDQTAD